MSAEASAASVAQPRTPVVAIPALPENMNVMDTAVKVRRFSPAMFGAILLCFLLSFVTISCQGTNIEFRFSGFDLIFGKTINGEVFEPLTPARLAFFAALIGLGVSFIRPPVGALLSAAVAILGIGAMFFIRRAIDGLMRAQNADMAVLTITYEPGYYLAFGLFLAVMAVNLIVAAPALNKPAGF
jgi:hypothetical protein